MEGARDISHRVSQLKTNARPKVEAWIGYQWLPAYDTRAWPGNCTQSISLYCIKSNLHIFRYSNTA